MKSPISGSLCKSSTRARPIFNLDANFHELNVHYFELRNKEMTPENLENFMILRQIMMRINEITKEINEIYKVFHKM
ncbi:hypothetical protein [Chryseobacterium indoltheticum]|uniref:hypothetical protein n=1 Tax=Chryseobacterium indoltheticum TaxID=254 RepID=UPI003F4965B3